MLPVCLKCEDWDAPEMFDIRSILIKGEIKRCCDTLKNKNRGSSMDAKAGVVPRKRAFLRKVSWKCLMLEHGC